MAREDQASIIESIGGEVTEADFREDQADLTEQDKYNDDGETKKEAK